MKNRNYGVALSKSKHHCEGVWCGYLTPSEICSLVITGGAKPEHYSWYEYAIKHKSEGKSNPMWFYFRPSVYMLKELRK